MKLSKRLQNLLDLVDPCEVLVDVGTDHAHLLIQAIIENKCKKAYGLDIASGPLRFAAFNIEKYEMSDRIMTMQMDGLQDFNQDANSFVIAGMGFETILHILNHFDFKAHHSIIVQSNTKIYEFRKGLMNSGFKIVDEKFFYDNKRPITILKLVKKQELLSESDLYLGPVLQHTENKEYLTYLTHEYEKMTLILEHNTKFLSRYELLKKYLITKGVTL